MELERDVRIFCVIEEGLAMCKDDAVTVTDTMEEEDILAAMERAEASTRMSANEWRQRVARCRTAYLYAAFSFYGTDNRLRALHIAKNALKELIELFADRVFPTGRLEQRLTEIRQAIAAE